MEAVPEAVPEDRSALQEQVVEEQEEHDVDSMLLARCHSHLHWAKNVEHCLHAIHFQYLSKTR
jgi:hypothetical protein